MEIVKVVLVLVEVLVFEVEEEMLYLLINF
jgi:hypothetical protein